MIGVVLCDWLGLPTTHGCKPKTLSQDLSSVTGVLQTCTLQSLGKEGNELLSGQSSGWASWQGPNPGTPSSPVCPGPRLHWHSSSFSLLRAPIDLPVAPPPAGVPPSSSFLPPGPALPLLPSTPRALTSCLELRYGLHGWQPLPSLCVFPSLSQNFYKSEINKEEMYIRYIHKLCDMHLQAENYTGECERECLASP